MGAADGEIASAFRLEVLCTGVWEPNTTFTNSSSKETASRKGLGRSFCVKSNPM